MHLTWLTLAIALIIGNSICGILLPFTIGLAETCDFL